MIIRLGFVWTWRTYMLSFKLVLWLSIVIFMVGVGVLVFWVVLIDLDWSLSLAVQHYLISKGWCMWVIECYLLYNSDCQTSSFICLIVHSNNYSYCSTPSLLLSIHILTLALSNTPLQKHNFLLLKSLRFFILILLLPLRSQQFLNLILVPISQTLHSPLLFCQRLHNLREFVRHVI
jgi:hypothetical protein